jgi:hypothetical protein
MLLHPSQQVIQFQRMRLDHCVVRCASTCMSSRRATTCGCTPTPTRSCPTSTWTEPSSPPCTPPSSRGDSTWCALCVSACSTHPQDGQITDRTQRPTTALLLLSRRASTWCAVYVSSCSIHPQDGQIIDRTQRLTPYDGEITKTYFHRTQRLTTSTCPYLGGFYEVRRLCIIMLKSPTGW